MGEERHDLEMTFANLKSLGLTVTFVSKPLNADYLQCILFFLNEGSFPLDLPILIPYISY